MGIALSVKKEQFLMDNNVFQYVVQMVQIKFGINSHNFVFVNLIILE